METTGKFHHTPGSSFPKTLEELKALVKERNFKIDKVDDLVCTSIIEKIGAGIHSFTDEEIKVMRGISFIGNVCGCDDDHRIGEDKKTCAYSYV